MESKNFPEGKYVATLNHGLNTRYGANPTSFGKVVFPSFPENIQGERMNFSLRIALAYSGFDIRKAEMESHFLSRSLVKGVGTLEEKRRAPVGGIIRDAADASLGMIAGPMGNFLVSAIEGAKGKLEGVVSQSNHKSSVISPVSGDSLADVKLRSTMFEGSYNLPAEFREQARIHEDMSAQGVVFIEAQISFIASAVEQLLRHMEENGIKSGKKYGSPRFVFRFEHMPVLNELPVGPGTQRNALMFVDIKGEGDFHDSGCLQVPVQRGLSDQELFEHSEALEAISRNLEKVGDATDDPVKLQALLLQLVENQRKIVAFNLAEIRAKVGSGARIDL